MCTIKLLKTMDGKTFNTKFEKIAIVGDTGGILQLMKHIPAKFIVCIIASSIRPQYLKDLKKISENNLFAFLVQPKFNTSAYSLFVQKLKKLHLDLLVCNSYSMIIRNDVLAVLKHNAVNIHGSLLPRNRGPNPIQWAIIRNERTIGVTMHYMDTGFDTGDIIAQKSIPIANKDTWVDVRRKMDIKIEEILSEQIPLVLSKSNKRRKQNHSDATSNTRITRDFPAISFKTMSNEQIYNLIRAQVYPLKGAFIPDKNGNIYIDKKISLEKIRELRKKYG